MVDRGKAQGASVLATLGTNGGPPAIDGGVRAVSTVRRTTKASEFATGTAVEITGHAKYHDGREATVVGHTPKFVYIVFEDDPKNGVSVRIQPKFLVIKRSNSALSALNINIIPSGLRSFGVAPPRPSSESACIPDDEKEGESGAVGLDSCNEVPPDHSPSKLSPPKPVHSATAMVTPARNPLGGGRWSGYVADDVTDHEDEDTDDNDENTDSSIDCEEDACRARAVVTPAGTRASGSKRSGYVSDVTDDEESSVRRYRVLARTSGSKRSGYISDDATDVIGEDLTDEEDNYYCQLLITSLSDRAEEAERNVETLKQRVQCPTCFDIKEEIYVRSCGHRTCFDCYWKGGRPCPNRCRNSSWKKGRAIARLYD